MKITIQISALDIESNERVVILDSLDRLVRAGQKYAINVILAGSVTKIEKDRLIEFKYLISESL